ncbi:hypothetical protein TNCV_5021481 [Trichonephila clavipes]|nr:hypothetical protein TNCV_5021481 [Trichonephila clavipes]
MDTPTARNVAPAGSEYAETVRSNNCKDSRGFPELANMVTKVAKLATNLVVKNDANLALPPRFRQVLIESPL